MFSKRRPVGGMGREVTVAWLAPFGKSLFQILRSCNFYFIFQGMRLERCDILPDN
jgi:hypothetical protein